MSQHTVAASCACSSSTAGSRCVGWVGASSCLFMIDLTGPVSRRERTTPGPASADEPDARHDLNSLKIHLLLEGGVRSDSSSGRVDGERAVRFHDERIFERV